MNTQNLVSLKSQVIANFATESSLTFEVARLRRILQEKEAILADAKARAESTAIGKNEAERKGNVSLVTFEQRQAVQVAEFNLAEAETRLRVAQLERSMISKLLSLEVTLFNHEPEPEAQKTLGDYIQNGEPRTNPWLSDSEQETEEPNPYSGNYSEE